MNAKLHRNERGVTALETAIILIAFVVVAAVFAFTILSTGNFLTERSKEAALSGLGQVQGSMELKGGIVVNATTTGPNGTIADVVFSVSNVAGGQPIDFTSTVTDPTYTRDTYNATGQQVVQIEYRDERQRQEITNWAVRKLGYNDGDNLLEERELFEITVPLQGNITTALGPNTTFVVEVKPPVGSPLRVQRLTPANIDSVMDLK
ncbi:MAG: archaellin/type IV pilin N-terminal domain-containing protein [Anaerolineae bacterium]